MRFSARAFIFIVFLSLIVTLFGPQAVFAQTNRGQTYTDYPTANPATHSTPQYIPTAGTTETSHIDPTLPSNQHVRIQTLVIDILSAVVCQLGGIDPVDPRKPCVQIDPVTRKLGYSQQQYDENGNPRLGGLLGASTHMIGMMYTPTIRAHDYPQYVAQNFGITKPAYAAPIQQDPTLGYGFNGLNPLFTLWMNVRNVAYYLLMLAFVVIGLGIMLRVKIDPRSVMTLQNQIPRIIVAIILVTFSYQIAALMIEAMWISTYVGINVITSAGNTNSLEFTNEPLSQLATANLLQDPLGFVHKVFQTNDDGGIGHLTDEISFGLGSFIEQIFRTFFGVTLNDSCVGWTGVNLSACLASVFGFIASILLWLVVLIIILRTLFSVWLTLLKAYTFVIFYTIGGPIFIIIGLLPNKGGFGFEKWLRSLGAFLAVFPVTAWMFISARLFMELFKDSSPDAFIPPLIFQPNIGIWGVMIAFGILLMTPTILAMLQEALKVQGTKHGSVISQQIKAGAAGPAGLTEDWLKYAWRPKTPHQNAGWLRMKAAGRPPRPDAQQFSFKNPRSWVDQVQKWRWSLAKEKGGRH